MEDSFRDGGVFLLWCLRYNRPKVLQHLLNEDMVEFWRFAQLKTLAWACLRQTESPQQLQNSSQILQILMSSPAMQGSYVMLPAIQKVVFVDWLFNLGNQNDNLRVIQGILSEKPYSSAFIC